MSHTILSKRSIYPHLEAIDSEIEFIPPPERDDLVSIDWLRGSVLSGKEMHRFTEFMIRHLQDFGFKVVDANKGHLGYKHSFNIQRKALDDSFEHVGRFAMTFDESSSNDGGMFELTGAGCQYLRTSWEHWFKMFEAMKKCYFRLSRVDYALDFSGNIGYNFMRKERVNVPTLAERGKNNGLFLSDFVRKKSHEQTISLAGDWTPLFLDSVSHFDYLAENYPDNGLTAYFNKIDSQNYFRVYEKGKQLLGGIEKTARGAVSPVDLSWVRIERQVNRTNTKKHIELESLIDPDPYFARGYSKLQGLFDLWIEYNNKPSVPPAEYNNPAKRKVTNSLAKKAFWAMRSTGRLVKTLVTQGFDAQSIVDILVGEKELKDYIPDLFGVDDFKSKCKQFKKALAIKKSLGSSPGVSGRIATDDLVPSEADFRAGIDVTFVPAGSDIPF